MPSDYLILEEILLVHLLDLVGLLGPNTHAVIEQQRGETWTVDPVLKSPINRFRFVDKKTAYAIGANVWKLDVPYDGT